MEGFATLLALAEGGEDIEIETGPEFDLTTEIAETDAAIDTLRARIQGNNFWGTEFPEGGTLANIDDILGAYDAELVALQNEISEAQTLEEYQDAVERAEERVKEIQNSVLRYAERIPQFESA